MNYTPSDTKNYGPNGLKRGREAALSGNSGAIPERVLYARKSENPRANPRKNVRPYNPNIIAEWDNAFLMGIYMLHDRGNTWKEVAKMVGCGLTHTQRLRGGWSATKPAMLHLANALGMSLVELLCLGHEEE